jgi:hypothetical protein
MSCMAMCAQNVCLHTGVVRKRIVPVCLTNDPTTPNGTPSWPFTPASSDLSVSSSTALPAWYDHSFQSSLECAGSTPSSSITCNGAEVGTLLSVQGNAALALVRVEALLAQRPLAPPQRHAWTVGEGIGVVPFAPAYWPLSPPAL